jgi:hypothetical protein
MARLYLKDVRVGSAKGYDPKIDQLEGWNAEMAKIPFYKTIDLDDCADWTNDIPYDYDPTDDRYIPHEDALGVKEAEAELVRGRTAVADSPDEAERLAVAAAEKARSDQTYSTEEVEEAGDAGYLGGLQTDEELMAELAAEAKSNDDNDAPKMPKPGKRVK